MTEQMVLRCKICGAHLEGAGKKRQITCPYCGIVNVFEKQTVLETEITCPACGTTNKREFEHCVECGQNLYQNCPKCGTRNEADASFCAKCGLDLEKAFRIQKNILNISLKRIAYQKSTCEPTVLICGWKLQG